MGEGGFGKGGGEGGGFGKGGGFGDKGKGKGKGKGKKGKGKGKGEEKEWVPCTKLGRLVKDGKVQSMEDVYLHALPIKEYQIVDVFFAPGTLKDEVMKIHPVQKMTSAGQTNRFVCYVLVGDQAGHIGLGNKCAKEVATAIRGGIISAKMNLIPVRRGYWGNRIGQPHTVPMKVAGKCGSVRIRLVPAPRGSGVVGSPTMKKMLAFAGVSDCFTSSCGHTRTKGNFMKATFEALRHTYAYLTPDLWRPTHFVKPPFQEWSDYLSQSKPTQTY
jgi:small subunit ribosomal protein S2e